jgi:hypothetical protein
MLIPIFIALLILTLVLLLARLLRRGRRDECKSYGHQGKANCENARVFHRITLSIGAAAFLASHTIGLCEAINPMFGLRKAGSPGEPTASR